MASMPREQEPRPDSHVPLPPPATFSSACIAKKEIKTTRRKKTANPSGLCVSLGQFCGWGAYANVQLVDPSSPILGFSGNALLHEC